MQTSIGVCQSKVACRAEAGAYLRWTSSWRFVVNVHHEAQVVCEGKTADNAMSEAPGQKPERRPDREEPQQTSEARRDEGPDGGTAAGPRPTKSVNARRVLSAILGHEYTSEAGMKPLPENTTLNPWQPAKIGRR